MISLDTIKGNQSCGDTISDLYYPCQERLVLSVCCLNKTITTLNQSVIIAGFVSRTFPFLDC